MLTSTSYHLSPRKYDYLLVLRGLCALAVVFCHYPFYLSDLVKFNFLDWLFNPFGYIPVLIFFTLSGYLITLGFIDGRHSADNLRGINAYYISRAIRIIPVYYLSIAVCCLIYWKRSTESPIDVLLLLPFIGNYKSESGIIFNHVYWTMPIEMLYFFFAPFIYILLKKSIKRYGELCVAVSVIVIFFLFRLNIFHGFDQSAKGVEMWRKDWLMTARCDFFYNLEAFILGGICAFVSKKDITQKIHIPYKALLFGTVISIVVLVFYTTTKSIILLNEHRIASYFLLYGIIPTIALWFLFIVILQIKQKHEEPNKNLLLLGEKIGCSAYGIYLFHMPILTVTESLMKPHIPSMSSTVMSMISLAATLFVSSYVYKKIEKPVNDMRRSFIKPVTKNCVKQGAS